MNIANINSPSVTITGTSATALPQKSRLLLINNSGTGGAYIETGASTVTATSLKAFIGAGQCQVFEQNGNETHIIAAGTGFNLIVQSVDGV